MKHLVSIHKPKKGLKKEMYHAQIEIDKEQSKRIHHERQCYNKTEKCRLLSRAAPVVAQAAAIAAERAV
jgi:hypothetical protein